MIIYYHLPLLVTEKLPRFAGWRTIRHNCQYIFHWTFTLSTLRSGRVSIYCVSINKGSYPFCAATWNVKLIFLALALRNNRQIIPVFVGRTTNLFSLPTQNNFNPFLFISLPKFIMKPKHFVCYSYHNIYLQNAARVTFEDETQGMVGESSRAVLKIRFLVINHIF